MSMIQRHPWLSQSVYVHNSKAAWVINIWMDQWQLCWCRIHLVSLHIFISSNSVWWIWIDVDPSSFANYAPGLLNNACVLFKPHNLYICAFTSMCLHSAQFYTKAVAEESHYSEQDGFCVTLVMPPGYTTLIADRSALRMCRVHILLPTICTHTSLVVRSLYMIRRVVMTT